MKLDIFTLLLIFLSIFHTHAFEFQDADLLFQTETTSDFSNAISSSTASEDTLSYIHVAIIAIEDDDKVFVLEASPGSGVREISLEEFLRESPKTKEGTGVVVKRLNIDFPKKQVIENAKSFLNQPYDWYYLPDNGKMYCSELVYESFKESNGKPIFEARPMNFRNADGSFPQFWLDLFKQLDTEIPQGVPGTNPNDLSKDVRLKEVYRFF